MNLQIYNNYVQLIAKHHSLTKAAAVAGVSQPALSAGLSALENKLGFTIFDRKTIPLTFTEKGLLYYEYLKKLDVLEKEFNQQIEALDCNASRSFSIGGPTAYVESIITSALCRKDCPFSDCSITIRSAPITSLIEQVSRKELDCFISTTENLPDNFEKRLLRHEQIYLVINKNNPLASKLTECQLNEQVRTGRGPVSNDYSVLSNEAFVTLERNQPMQRQMDDFFKKYSITPSHVMTVNQVSTAVNLAIRGYGICMASEASLRSHSDLSAVNLYRLPDIIMGRNIYVAYEKDYFMPVACRDFIDYLVKLENV